MTKSRVAYPFTNCVEMIFCGICGQEKKIKVGGGAIFAKDGFFSVIMC